MVCSYCEGNITGVFIKAFGKHWHKNHLLCKYCKEELNDTYMDEDGPVCKQCKDKEHDNPIGEENVKIGDKIYDKNSLSFINKDMKNNYCFIKECEHDGEKITDLEGMHSLNGKFYCEEHFKQMTKDLGIAVVTKLAKSDKTGDNEIHRTEE